MPLYPLLLKIGRKVVETLVVSALTLGIFFVFTYALAEEPDTPACDLLTEQTTCESATDCAWNIVTKICATKPAAEPEKPVTHGIVQIAEKAADPNWKPNGLDTFGLKFLVRAKEALAWAIGIKDAGFDNSAITTSYNKVLTIVNSLFILGMLAIAAMWMFSIFIPRRYLRNVVLVYAAAVIFVNFALPVNRLLIDGTNLLQKTLLVKDNGSIGITDIIETPDYTQAVGYQDATMVIPGTAEKELKMVAPVGEEDIAVGKIAKETVERDAEGNAIVSEQEDTLKLNANQPIKLSESDNFKIYNEQALYGFAMMLLTGIAYFILALIFILRIIILWALLILSPALFILAIFRTTRGWFMNWLGLYGRWLLIGPLTALGIAIIVNIWQSVGLPITSAHAGMDFAKDLTNISFRLPGATASNSLSSTGEMMQYLVFLLMLYIPVFFAFALTRQKVWQGVGAMIVERIREPKRAAVTAAPMEAKETVVKEKEAGPAGFVGTLKNFLGEKVSKVTETAMPNRMRIMAPVTAPMPTAQNFMPEQLALTGVHGLMQLMGEKEESRRSRETVIEKLADPEKLSDPAEQKNAGAIRREIENRALRGDAESMVLMGEIREKARDMGTAEKETIIEKTAGIPVVSEGQANIQVNVAAPELAQEKTVEGKNKAAPADEVKTATKKLEEDEESEEDKDKEEETPKTNNQKDE